MKSLRSPYYWLAVALLASVGGNVFLGGYLAGRGAFSGPPGLHGGPPGPPMRPDEFFERLAERLPAADAAILRRFAAENRDAFERDDAQRRDFPRRLRAALTAEPFDAAAFEKLLADHDAAIQQAHAVLRQRIAAAAASLSPEARRVLAESPLPGPPPPPGPPPGPPPPR